MSEYTATLFLTLIPYLLRMMRKTKINHEENPPKQNIKKATTTGEIYRIFLLLLKSIRARRESSFEINSVEFEKPPVFNFPFHYVQSE